MFSQAVSLEYLSLSLPLPSYTIQPEPTTDVLVNGMQQCSLHGRCLLLIFILATFSKKANGSTLYSTQVYTWSNFNNNVGEKSKIDWYDPFKCYCATLVYMHILINDTVFIQTEKEQHILFSPDSFQTWPCPLCPTLPVPTPITCPAALPALLHQLPKFSPSIHVVLPHILYKLTVPYLKLLNQHFPTHSINLSYLYQKKHPPQTHTSTQKLYTVVISKRCLLISCVDWLHLSMCPCLDSSSLFICPSMGVCKHIFDLGRYV